MCLLLAGLIAAGKNHHEPVVTDWTTNSPQLNQGHVPENPFEHPEQHVPHDFGYSYAYSSEKGLCLIERDGFAHILFPTAELGRSIPKSQRLGRNPITPWKPC
jgi:hypothetical protein